jgi:hypothetical protein
VFSGRVEATIMDREQLTRAMNAYKEYSDMFVYPPEHERNLQKALEHRGSEGVEGVYKLEVDIKRQ